MKKNTFDFIKEAERIVSNKSLKFKENSLDSQLKKGITAFLDELCEMEYDMEIPLDIELIVDEDTKEICGVVLLESLPNGQMETIGVFTNGDPSAEEIAKDMGFRQ